MKKTAEAVSLGHPDKTADFISSYILDKIIKQDAHARYAVEVMIKGNTIVLGGEVSTSANAKYMYIWAKNALKEIGYNEAYSKIWGDCAINPKKVKVINLVGRQSGDIYRGIEQNGWGDQGVFVGYACRGENNINPELYYARKLNAELYKLAKSNPDLKLGLDIKTQVTIDDIGDIETVIVAIPMLEDVNLQDFVLATLGTDAKNIIINGTGRYTSHGSIADCGITGRKLACDFYSTASPIGGGSPWTKDASKADLTLNLYARKLALQYLGDNDECFVYLSSCIGRADLPSATVKTIKNGTVHMHNISIDKKPDEIINILGLNKPVFAQLCRHSVGL
jgi:S-adenosylmethionine synthetase